MNKITKWILIILCIIAFILLVPKPYSNSFHSNCHSYPNGGTDAGLCIGMVYPIYQETPGTPDQYVISQNDGYCSYTRKGWVCIGYSIFENNMHIG